MAKRNRENKRVRPVRIVVIIVLLAIIAYCLYQVLPYVWNNLKEKNAFEQMSQDYTNVGDRNDENWWYTDVDVDVAGLKSQYPDVIGWIRFDDPKDTILSIIRSCIREMMIPICIKIWIRTTAIPDVSFWKGKTIRILPIPARSFTVIT